MSAARLAVRLAVHLAGRALAILVTAAAIVATVPLGCRQVLGISSFGNDALTCDTYCDAIAASCTATELQYGSRDACMGLCATFPVGTTGDTTGNTLGCRIHMLTLLDGAEGTCAAAGPSGTNAAGGDQCADTECDTFCNSALQVCPTDFTSLADCTSKCTALPICTKPYEVPSDTCIPDYGSVQCRYYHLTAATLDAAEHCPHVVGIGYCSPKLAACPSSSDFCNTTSP